MHIVFVDSNVVGLNALTAAKRAGHVVTFVGSRRFTGLIGGLDAVRQIDGVGHVVEIESALDEAELATAVASIHGERPIDALLTVLDFCALPVARCAAKLGFAGPDPAAVALAQDKAACRERIAADLIPSVPHARVSDLATARAQATRIGYPLFAKPNRGALSLHASRIGSDAELAAYFAASAPVSHLPQGVADALSVDVILERYVDGPLFSVEVAAAGGDRAALMVSARKRCTENPAIELGTTMPAPVRPETWSALVDYALRVTESLGLDLGIFHIEIVLGPDGPVLIEVNPRIMGGNMPTAFRLATGLDVYDVLLSIYLDRRLPETCRSIRAGRAACTRMIGPVSGGTVRASLSPDWSERFMPNVANWRFPIAAGARLQGMGSSVCPHFFQLVSESPVEASLLAEWVIGRIDEATQVEMRRSSEDYLLT